MTFFRDTWIVFARAMRLSLRQPLWVIIGLMQPILYLTLFGPLLLSMAQAPGFPPGDAWQIFVPGLLVQMAADAFARIKLPNTSPGLLGVDQALVPGLSGAYNVLNDAYTGSSGRG